MDIALSTHSLLSQVSAADDDDAAAMESSDATALHLDGGSSSTSSAASPAGHVTVCGVELRTRPGASPAPPAQPLVMTPTVRRNVKSLALALCGVRAVGWLAPCSALPACSASGARARGFETQHTERHKAL